MKWVQAMKPSRIGLLRSLSSSRASESSAAARGAAIRGQGNRYAIPARSDICDGLGEFLIRGDPRLEVFLFVPARLDFFEIGRQRPALP